ncbi:hypothetical protein VC34_12330 [Pseudomonas fluorescens]|uniref:Uncharacterized protein n=1 Tax=Pseudomonas fluorescens TaxID=294 RepID=A0A0F4TK82_PSEFL|nr:hypothetical protein VC34_12330 [Pseudomonas fluorescens]
MFLPPVSLDGVDAAKAGSKVKTAEAPAASVSIFRRVYPSVWLMELPFHIFAVSHGPPHFSRRTHEAGHISIATDDHSPLNKHHDL